MAEVVWTPRALADLQAVGDYVAADAPGYAELLVRRLLAATERLGVFPHSGRVVPELVGTDFREVIYRSYRVVYLYFPDEERVEVLTVFHSSRPLGGLS